MTLIVCEECENGIHENCITHYLNENDPNRLLDTRCCICEVCNSDEN